MKISIITITYNSAETIEDTIKSVQAQDYQDIEHIIIDGKSTDNTLDIVSRYKAGISKIISEADDGLYDALNKGIKNASGDIVGILHSDD
ncbi:MAG: glycosyltransferase, partial [Bacteroidia bacterium]|nr:glycosyltransferase [Bacteroidia bacterium]